jgi:hypothetical protein
MDLYCVRSAQKLQWLGMVAKATLRLTARVEAQQFAAG